MKCQEMKIIFFREGGEATNGKFVLCLICAHAEDYVS